MEDVDILFGHLVYIGILPPLGIFCGHLAYFVVIWYILWSFVIFCSHLLYFVNIWYNVSRFGMLYQEKSGNPGDTRMLGSSCLLCVDVFKACCTTRASSSAKECSVSKRPT
jgi:hypothetical protein